MARIPNQTGKADYPQGVIDEEIEYEETEELSGIENMLADLGDIHGSTIWIYRQPGNGVQKQEYLMQMSADGLELGDLLEQLRSEYGGGNYCLWFRRNGRVIGKRNLSIAKQAEKAPNQIMQKQETTADILRAMQEMQQKSEQNLASLMQIMVNNRPDPMQQMQQMLTMMGALRDAMGINNQQTQPINQQPQKSTIEQIKEMLEVQNLMKELAGESSGESSLMEKALMKFGEPLVKLVEHAAAQDAEIKKRRMQESQKAPSLPKPSPDETLKLIEQNTPKLPAQENEQMGIVDKFKKAFHPMSGHINTLINFARHNADVNEVAELVLDNTPEAYHDKILEIIEKGEIVKELSDINPEAANYAEWFTKLGAAIADQFDTTSDDDTLDETESNGIVNDNHTDVTEHT